MGGLINITSPAITAVISDMFESVGAYGSIRLMSLSLGFAFFSCGGLIAKYVISARWQRIAVCCGLHRCHSC